MLYDQHALYLRMSLMGRSAEDRSYLYVHRNDVTVLLANLSPQRPHNVTGINSFSVLYHHAVWDVSGNNVSVTAEGFSSAALLPVACVGCLGVEALLIARGNTVIVRGKAIAQGASMGGVGFIYCFLHNRTLAVLEANTASAYLSNAAASAGVAPAIGTVALQRPTLTNGSKVFVIGNVASLSAEHQMGMSGGPLVITEGTVTEPIGVGSPISSFKSTAEHVWRHYFEQSSADGVQSLFIAYLDSPSAHPLSASAAVIFCDNCVCRKNVISPIV